MLSILIICAIYASVVIGIIILSKIFITHESRVVMVKLFILSSVVFILSLLDAILAGYIKTLVYSDDPGIQVLGAMSILGVVSINILTFILTIHSNNISYDIINNYDWSKKQKTELSDFDIETEAKIRLQVERLKDTITFTDRELEAKKYVESIR